MTTASTTPIVDFLNRFIAALGIMATVNVEETADGPRLNLTGDEAELLVRHRGEPRAAADRRFDDRSQHDRAAVPADLDDIVSGIRGRSRKVRHDDPIDRVGGESDSRERRPAWLESLVACD